MDKYSYIVLTATRRQSLNSTRVHLIPNQTLSSLPDASIINPSNPYPYIINSRLDFSSYPPVLLHIKERDIFEVWGNILLNLQSSLPAAVSMDKKNSSTKSLSIFSKLNCQI